MKHSFELRAEAVACLWENMIEERDDMPILSERFYREGTAAMRHWAIDKADTVLDLYDALSGDERDELMPYDWEFVPRVMRLLLAEEPMTMDGMVAELKRQAAHERSKRT